MILVLEHTLIIFTSVGVQKKQNLMKTQRQELKYHFPTQFESKFYIELNEKLPAL